MAGKTGYEYYIGPLYFWRIRRQDDRVEIYERSSDTGEERWLDADLFQGLRDHRFGGKARYVSMKTFYKEARAEPFAVKDQSVIDWHREKGTSHV